MIFPVRILIPIVLLTLASGCASIDFDYPRSESTAFEGTEGTYLGKRVATLTVGQAESQSGFSMLSDGVDALAMRLLLAQRAEQSIDLQTYVMHVDVTGSALLSRLLEAADRGVRVRLLLDDYYAEGYDAGLAGLDSHPNVEGRIFNPFYRGSAGRLKSTATDFGRVNRRMHNKSFVVDNQVAIIGGRNIGDEYFDARADEKFTDLDALAIGPVVNDLSRMFDTYWNHETALPVPAFAEMPNDPDAELERLRVKFSQTRDDILDTAYARAIRQQVLAYIETDAPTLTWAPYLLAYDEPDIGVKSRAEEAKSIRTPLIESVESAQNELIIITPYFVPSKSGIDRFRSLRERGVEVTIVTNSLASTNQWLVHSGYARVRKPLLESGVAIREVRPDRDQSASGVVTETDTLVTMHTKVFVVDRSAIFLGSFNFDPRSAYINTESGVIIESQEMAEEFAAMVDNALTNRTYEVYLNDKEKLRWRATENGEEIIYDKEPNTTWAQRFKVGVARLLPIRGQL